MLHPGLYEQVINKEIDAELGTVEKVRQATAPIDQAEASVTLAQYLSDIIIKGFDTISESKKKDDEKVAAQVALANQIVTLIQDTTNEDRFAGLSIAQRAEQLLALLQKDDPRLAAGKSAKDVVRPETSVAQSSLFTGAALEPQMYTELKKEIVSSDRIDMIVSFIKWSGLRLIINELTEFTQHGGNLRIITTSYMGATDVKAIEELNKLPNTTIKINYDTKPTRLHAKAYIFYRNSGFTTAYVGSSNMSNPALSSGLEWNVKLTQKDLPSTLEKIDATFDSYWNSSDFVFYTEDQREQLAIALKNEKYHDANQEELYTVDVRPYSYQQEILDQLDAERRIHGYTRNLVVAATGTGKTVISALDYKRFCQDNPDKPNRLLFVAHREEILKQSMYTFRAVLKDANFGDLYVGGHRPDNVEHLFISIQTLNSQKFWEKTDAAFYDYIVFDECHHMPARTYQSPLQYYTPQILLGLTATPERMDGETDKILNYFNNRIAAEIRLPEAIDRKLLCPFQYFGVTDSVDLDQLKWSAGGYDKKELSNIYTMEEVVANRRADLIVSSLIKYVTDINDVKGLGFCVSVEHATFMSNYFNAHGIPSMYLVGTSPSEDRSAAKQRLVSGEIRFIFVVDIYNEGVDIPEVNTVLFLRPTESLTIFLQQLGRGLRLAENKECLTVLDFIGQANKRYNFEDKFASLLSNCTHGIAHEIEKGFISAPKGCYIQLEKKAEKYILDNIRDSYSSKRGLQSRISTFTEDTGLELTFLNFVSYYHIDPRIIYKKKETFYSLSKRVDVHVSSDAEESLLQNAHKILFRVSTLDSPKLIDFLLKNLHAIEERRLCDWPVEEQLMLKMLYVTIWEKTPASLGFTDIINGLTIFKNCTPLFKEATELLQYCRDKIRVIGRPADLLYPCPLEIYCTYTRTQILAAFDFIKDYAVSEGVLYLKDKNTDLLFTTLNKADKYYSPTTAYHDYSINETLFHWQSQSTKTDTSPTGLRYIRSAKKESTVLLFVRDRKSDFYGAQPFAFLGPVTYVQHTGSAPMNITWKMKHPIPARYIKITNKLLAE